MNQVSHFFGPVEFLSALDVALIALLILKRTMSGLYKIMLVLFILISVAFGILHKNGNELDHASSTYGPVRQVENLFLPLTMLSFALLAVIALYETVHWVRKRL
jgi:uncharacterized membrane protein